MAWQIEFPEFYMKAPDMMCWMILTSLLGPVDSSELQLIAHRGGVVDDQHIENSLPAIEEAIRRGYWMLEVDIRRSSDGEPIAHHDADFRRYYADPRRVDQLTVEQIKQLTAQVGGTHPLTLAEYVAACKGKIRLMLDIKVSEADPKFFTRIRQILQANELWQSAYLLGPDSAKKFYGDQIKSSIGVGDLRRAIDRGENVAAEHFLFGIAARFDVPTVQLAQQHGVHVVPAVNTFRYPGDDDQTQARDDIRRLRRENVICFQIDSVYEPWFDNVSKVAD